MLTPVLRPMEIDPIEGVFVPAIMAEVTLRADAIKAMAHLTERLLRDTQMGEYAMVVGSLYPEAPGL